MNRRIVFLYTELAEYIKSCMDRLAETGVEVYVFAYPVNPEAPFRFDFENSKCTFYPREDFSFETLEARVRKINPAAIVCSGWIDKDYIRLCRSLSKSCRTILALDSQIETGLRPLFSRLRAQLMYKAVFSDAWVPGKPQVAFAKKLGFRKEQISEGFYTADTAKWSEMGSDLPLNLFPKRFVFVGRYVDFKGIEELWQAYTKLGSTEWQLYCAGQGELYDLRCEYPGIHHLGFVQPDDFGKFVARGGVFVLPSHKEPWGVVLHEFAAAGYPIICTDKVGAASEFLKNGENGYSVSPGNVNELAGAMQKMIGLTDQELSEMSRLSKKLAQKISTDAWIKTAVNYLESNT